MFFIIHICGYIVLFLISLKNQNIHTFDKDDAEVGPKSFEADKDIEPKTWPAVYEGGFAEAARRPFRFTGRFDDTLEVDSS